MITNGTLQKHHDETHLPVAVDAMGGDHGLEVQVEGALQAYKEFGAKSILVGPEADLNARLDALGGRGSSITVTHAPEVITMDDTPAKAVRRKPNSSLCIAYDLVQDGKASCILSAGNSGAMMAAGSMTFGLVPGIERPAIATLIPAVGDGKPNVILDSGANVGCHAHNLVQFAVMGSIYYSSLLNEKRPRVALLSNGTEPTKGTDVIRAASMLLSQMEIVNYVGYVEGRDVASASTDVVVCDGFVGNVLLKALEGAVALCAKQLLHERQKSAWRKIGLFFSKDVYRTVFREQFDYTAHGGAPLLGLRKLAVVLHGSSGSRAVKNAIRVANSFVRVRMTEKITSAITQLEEQMPEFGSDLLSGGLGKQEFSIPGRHRRKLEAGTHAVEGNAAIAQPAPPPPHSAVTATSAKSETTEEQ